MSSSVTNEGSPTVAGAIDRIIRSLSINQSVSSLSDTSPASAPDPEPSSPEQVDMSVPSTPASCKDTSPKARDAGPLNRIRTRIRKAVNLQTIPQAHLDQLSNINDTQNSQDYCDLPTFAERIRAVIDSFPSPTPRSSRMTPKLIKQSTLQTDDDGRPITPPGAARVKDQRLLRKLFNPVFMNAERFSSDNQSIWSLLSSIRHDDDANPSSGTSNDTDSIHSVDSHAFSDNTSFMMYSPLIPTKDDLVEIADSEVIIAPSTTTLQLPIEHPASPVARNEAFKWPWSKKESARGPNEQDDTNTGLLERRTWIPSTTKLSCEVMWWGYRLYLPPPVLAILNDKQLEATKRAALITSALTWLLSNLPVVTLPLPLQPIVLLLQKLVPFVSYIGTFISWSWSTIKGYDAGYGVTLSATWILPVALLPSTWNEEDWPGENDAGTPSTPPAVSPIPSIDQSSIPEDPSLGAAGTPRDIRRGDSPSEIVNKTSGTTKADRAIQTQTPSDAGRIVPLPSERDVQDAKSGTRRKAQWVLAVHDEPRCSGLSSSAVDRFRAYRDDTLR